MRRRAISATHSYFARHGYVGARVDIRGFGNSEGTPTDREYSAQEQRDGDEVIAWLAHQSWSNGNVGMLGISWGGFNSIQMALRNPPALKATGHRLRSHRRNYTKKTCITWTGSITSMNSN